MDRAPYHSHRMRAVRRREPRTVINPCIKYCLFFSNFIFWLAGGIVVCLVTWVLVQKKAFVRDVFDFIFDPAIMLCVAGCVVFILSFLGCFGSLRENVKCLRAFYVSLLTLLVVEVILGIFIFVFFYWKEVRDRLPWLNPELTLMNALVKYREPDQADLRDLIDSVQKQFQCCGVRGREDGYRDWQSNVYFNCSEENLSPERCGVPYSCCVPKTGQRLLNLQCGYHTTNKPIASVRHQIYTQGCILGFGKWLEKNALIFGVICFSILGPQAIAISLAHFLVDQIRLQRSRWTQTGLTMEDVNGNGEYTETYTLI